MPALLQLCVLSFGLLEDGDVGVGVFPEREEAFVSGERPNAGGVGIRALRGSRLQSVGAPHTQMFQGLPHQLLHARLFLRLQFACLHSFPVAATAWPASNHAARFDPVGRRFGH
jgi:hypothetical protein